MLRWFSRLSSELKKNEAKVPWGKPRKHDCATVKRLATQAKAKLGWRRQRDQLKLEMECLEKLEHFVWAGGVAREAKTEYQMTREKIQDGMPMEIIINSAL